MRLLAPFDPVVWDRRRFELLWGWPYRFEAYTPAAKRVRGHYALPLLWRDQVIGWANLSVKDGVLTPDVGFVVQAPKDKAFAAALEDQAHFASLTRRIVDSREWLARELQADAGNFHWDRVARRQF